MKKRKQFLAMLLAGFLVLGGLQNPVIAGEIFQQPEDAVNVNPPEAAEQQYFNFDPLLGKIEAGGEESNDAWNVQPEDAVDEMSVDSGEGIEQDQDQVENTETFQEEGTPENAEIFQGEDIPVSNGTEEGSEDTIAEDTENSLNEELSELPEEAQQDLVPESEEETAEEVQQEETLEEPANPADHGQQEEEFSDADEMSKRTQEDPFQAVGEIEADEDLSADFVPEVPQTRPAEEEAGKTDAAATESADEIPAEEAPEEVVEMSDAKAAAAESGIEKITLDANGGVFSDVSIDEDFGYFSSDFKQVHLNLDLTDWWPSFDRYMTYSGGSKKVIGWSKTRTGKAVLGITFDDTEFYRQFPNGGPCTLYAVWADTVIITLNLNGGFAGDDYDSAWDEILQEEVSYVSTLRMRALKGSNLKNFEANAYCYWYGHRLKGWALSKTGKPSQDVALTKDCTLYAIWEKDPDYELLKKITFKKTAISMKKGETAYVGCEMEPSFRSVKWTSSNPSVADYRGIYSEGLNRSIMIHAYAGGTATITASALDGSGVKASVKVTVARPKVTKITLDKVSTSLKKGATTTVKVKAVTPLDGTRAVTWTSSNTKVATVDANGKVKAVNAGTAIITATSRDGSGVKASCRVTVKAPASIAKATVTCPAAKVWTGWALTPVPTVKVGSKTLTKGTDFTLSYKNNKNVGTATVTITGKGNYTGTINRTFRINPKPTVISKVTPATGKLTLTWKKQAAQTSGYQIQFSSRSDFKTQKTVKVASAAATSRALTGLARKHKYYVRIRTYKQVGSQYYYSTWSGAKSATTK